MKRRWLGRRSGFTLLEVTVTALLLGMVGLSFAYLYMAAQRFTIQSLHFTGTQNESSFALEHIKRNLLLATAIAQPPNVAAPGNTTTSLQFTWQRNFTAPVQTSCYTLPPNTTDLLFYETCGAGTPDVVARNILSATFTRANVSQVDIVVQSQQASGGDTQTTRLQTSVSPRGVFQ